jgi:hypothetical protein
MQRNWTKTYSLRCINADDRQNDLSASVGTLLRLKR